MREDLYSVQETQETQKPREFTQAPSSYFEEKLQDLDVLKLTRKQQEELKTILEKGVGIEQATPALKYFLSGRADINVMRVDGVLDLSRIKALTASLIQQGFFEKRYSVFNLPVMNGNHAVYVIFDKDESVFYYFDPYGLEI